MSNQEILATYIDGVFRVVDPESVELSEGQEVVIAIKPIDRATYILELAKQVYAGLSEEEIAEIEKEYGKRSSINYAPRVILCRLVQRLLTEQPISMQTS